MKECQFIVHCYGRAIIDERSYMVMELAPFGNLSQLLQVLPFKQHLNTLDGFRLCIKWMHEIASAVAYVHDRNVRHGDVTPYNVLVFSGLRVKLGGFALSTYEQQNLVVYDGDESDDEAMSGTVGYMAPEQLMGLRPSLKSDIFGLGMTCLFTINNQRRPGYEFRKQWEDAKANCLEAYPNQVDLVNNVLNLMERCLSPRREDRPSSTEVAETLNIFLATLPCDDSFIEMLILDYKQHK